MRNHRKDLSQQHGKAYQFTVHEALNSKDNGKETTFLRFDIFWNGNNYWYNTYLETTHYQSSTISRFLGSTFTPHNIKKVVDGLVDEIDWEIKMEDNGF